jgi:hypothetical protein
MATPIPYRLTFMLPRNLLLSVAPGRHSPCLHGCVLMIDRGLVEIEGPSRELIFQQVRRVMRIVAKGHEPFSTVGVLTSPHPPGRDGWTIIVGADVSIMPTTIEPDLGSAA